MKYSKGKVYQYSIDGKFMNEFENVIAAGFELKIKHSSISTHLLNRARYCHGFLFSRTYYLKYPIENLKRKPIAKMQSYEKDIFSYDCQGVFLKKYNNLKEVSERNDIRGWVRACLKGENKTYDEKIWLYDYYKKLPEEILNKILNKRIVHVNENGKLVGIYKNVSEASRKTGLSDSSISLVSTGKRNNLYGNKFFKYNEYKKICENSQKKAKAKEKIVTISNKK